MSELRQILEGKSIEDVMEKRALYIIYKGDEEFFWSGSKWIKIADGGLDKAKRYKSVNSADKATVMLIKSGKLPVNEPTYGYKAISEYGMNEAINIKSISKKLVKNRIKYLSRSQLKDIKPNANSKDLAMIASELIESYQDDEKLTIDPKDYQKLFDLILFELEELTRE